MTLVEMSGQSEAGGNALANLPAVKRRFRPGQVVSLWDLSRHSGTQVKLPASGLTIARPVYILDVVSRLTGHCE